MNLRQSITRNVTYSMVTLIIGEKTEEYTLYGSTTPAKEMKRYLKTHAITEELPTININVITEQRAISIENFIANSEIVKKENSNNESEDL